MKFKALVFLLLILTVNFWILPCPAFAEEDISVAKINPASSLYFLKAVKENIEFKFAQTSNQKDQKRIEFATNRLREVKALIGVKEELIPPTLERYIVYLNTMDDKGKKINQSMIEPKQELIVHINTLRKIYDQVISKEAKMSIRSVLNNLAQRLDVAPSSRQIVCDLYIKEASSSALKNSQFNQTEQLVLKMRATHLCSPNL